MATVTEKHLTCYDYTYDQDGRQIATLCETPHAPGSHTDGCMVCITVASDDNSVIEQYNIGAKLPNDEALNTIESFKNLVEQRASSPTQPNPGDNNWYQ